jgi:hypothetical protein
MQHVPTGGFSQSLNPPYIAFGAGLLFKTGDLRSAEVACSGGHATASWQSVSRSHTKLFAVNRFRLDNCGGRAVGFVFVSKNWQIHFPSGAICSPSAHFDFSSAHFHSPRSQILRLMQFSTSERLQTDRVFDPRAVPGMM